MLRLFENRDCMEGMAEYPDKFFDLAIVDPPYGIGASNNTGFSEVRRKNGTIGYTKRKLHKPKKWDNKIPCDRFFLELKRVSVNQIIWGGNYFNLPPTRGIICWDKKQPFKNFSAWEMAWSSFDYPAKKFEYDNKGFMNSDGPAIHPTQKPVALYRWLLENYAKPGDKILDTHVGSASSLIAFEAGGFEYVGFEIDKDYYDAAKKRLETWRSLPLFDEKKAEESNQLDLAI